MRKFSAGDRVMVRQELEPGKTYDGVQMFPYMLGFRGLISTISIVLDPTHYLLNASAFVWSADMLEQAECKIHEQLIVTSDGETTSVWHQMPDGKVHMGYAPRNDWRDPYDFALSMADAAAQAGVKIGAIRGERPKSNILKLWR